MENKQTDLEEVIQEVKQETPQVEEVAPELDLEKFDSKDNPDIIKVDLSKPPTNEVKENNSNDTGVAGVNEDAEPTQSEDQVQPQGEVQEEVQVLEEVKEFKEEVSEAIDKAEATGQALPEGVQKLVDFIADTGGSLEDYVRLNRDVKDIDDHDALREYYQRTKPHLDSDEINFLLEDKFSYDEELDEAKDIKRKKLALKEQVAEAKTYLDGQKSKYYEEIKAGSNLTEDQQKAVDFFNRYNKESEQNQQVITRQRDTFNEKTDQLFNDKFKGFEYNVGDKVYRFNVNNVDQVKESQSDINNMFKKFLDKNETMSDAKGYHRSLFTAMNADIVAQHFYEQGKADAIKENVAQSKNISMDPRKSHNSIEAGGVKVRVLGDDSNSYGFKIKNKK